MAGRTAPVETNCARINRGEDQAVVLRTVA